MTTTAPDPEKEQEEANRKRRNAALGLMGAGAGFAGLGHLVLDRQSENRVHDLVGGYNSLARTVGGSDRPYDLNHHIVRSYGEAGSQALGAKVFGLPARQFVEKLRYGPWMDRGDRWKGESSATHYDAFQRGPLYGYLQMLNETAEKENTFGSKKKTDKFLAQLMERTNDVSRKTTGTDAVMEDGQNMTRRLGWGTQTLGVEDQRKVLDQMGDRLSFSGWTSPIFRRRYRQLLGATAPGSMESYKKYGLKMGLPALTLKNTAIGGGLLLAGAGAGLGISHLLEQRRKRRELEVKNRLATEPQIS